MKATKKKLKFPLNKKVFTGLGKDISLITKILNERYTRLEERVTKIELQLQKH